MANRWQTDSFLLAQQYQEMYEKYVNELFSLLQKQYNLNISLPFAC